MLRCQRCFFIFPFGQEKEQEALRMKCPFCGCVTDVYCYREERVIREARRSDLDAILELYLYLHETSLPEDSEQLDATWESIISDPNHHLIICEVDGKIVSSCVCVIIPNLTRNVRPYAFVENVVTHAEYRGKGYAGACLEYARKIAEESNCYKIMLLTGSKNEKTLDFYRNAGYNSSDKTAFVQWLDM